MTPPEATPTLHGRARELAAAMRWGDPAGPADGGGFVLVRGPAGAGRSRLLTEIGEHLDHDPVRGAPDTLVVTAGWRRDSTTTGPDRRPFGPLVDRLVAIQAMLRPAERAAIQRLRAVDAAVDPTSDAGVPGLVDAVGGVLAELGRHRRVLLGLDDVHLAPPLVVGVLRGAGQRPAGTAAPGWRCVLTVRDSWPEADDDLLAELTELAGGHVVDLAPLPPDRVEALVSEALGCGADDSLVAAVRDALGPLAGVPGAVLELVAALRADDAVVVAGGRGHLRAGAPALHWPAGAVQVGRLTDRPAPWQQAFRVVARLGGVPTDAVDVLAAAGVPDPGAAVAGLTRAGLLVEVARGVRPSYPALVATVAAGPPPPEVRAAARMLLDRALRDPADGPDDGSEQVARTADLVVVARPGSLPDGAALRILDVADECLPAQPDRVARWCEAVRAATPAGGAVHQRALEGWAAAAAAAGDWRACRAAAAEVLAEVDDDPEARAAAYLRLTWAQYEAGDGAAMQSTLARAHAVLPESAVEAVERQQARIHLADGDLVAARAVIEDLGRSPGADLAWAGFATMLLAALRGELDRFAELAAETVPGATPAALAEVDEALAFGDFRAVEHALLPRPPSPGGVLQAYQETRASFVTGRWDDALHTAAELATVAVSGSTRAAAGLLRSIAAEIAGHRGDLAAAAEWLAGADDTQPFGHVVAWARAGAVLAGGDPAGALQVVDDARQPVRRRGVVLGRELLLARAVEAARASGDTGETEARLAVLAEHARSVPADHVRLLWLLAAAPDDARSARDAWTLARRMGRPFDTARAALHLTGPARRSARAVLAAHATFRGLGAARWLPRTEQRLQELDVPVPAAPEPVVDLTFRERQVGDLLAVGLDNRHIARQLGVGEKTVEGYVTRLLRKAGVRSRVQLAIAWDRL